MFASRARHFVTSSLLLGLTARCGGSTSESPAPCLMLADAAAIDAITVEADVSPPPAELDAAPERDAPSRDQADTASDTPSPPDAAIDAELTPDASDAGTDAPASDAAPLDADSFGNPQMTCVFTVVAPGRQRITAVAVNRIGVIAIAGHFAAGFDLGDGPLSLPDGGTYGGFVAELDTFCRVRWSRLLAQSVTGIGFDSIGNLWAAGGGLDGPSFLEIEKFDDAGNMLSNVRFATAGKITPTAFTVDSAGNAFVGGTLHGSMTLGGDTISFGTDDASGSTDHGILLAKFTSAGALAWAKGFGGATPFDGKTSCFRQPFALAADPSGDIFIGGSYGCGLSLGGTALPTAPVVGSGSAYFGFLGRLSGADGGHVWSRGMPAAEVYGLGLAGNDLLVTGNLTDAHDFGSGPIGPTGSGTIAGYIAGMPSNGGAPVWGRLLDVPASPPAEGPLGHTGGNSCGASLGERCLLSGSFEPATRYRSTQFLQAVNGHGDVAWTFEQPYPVTPTAAAAGYDRDIVWGGSSFEPTHYGAWDEDEDVYLARFVRW